MIIAIDGPAGCGKSTLSWELARRVHFSWLGTGLLYRALAAQALADGVWPGQGSSQALVPWLRAMRIDYQADPPRPHRAMVNGREMARERLDALETARAASELSRLRSVREHLTCFFRRWAEGRDVVAEGRDATSVIFPRAEVKIFLTADLEERVRRRFEELAVRRPHLTVEDVRRELTERDQSDSTRPLSPLRQVAGARVIDTTDLAPAESVARLLAALRALAPQRHAWYAIVRNLLWLVGKLTFRVTVEGMDDIPERGGFILASNHESYLDPCLLAVASKRELTFLARDTLFKQAVFGGLIRSLNAIPLRRDASDRQGLDGACRALAKGAGLVLFPEGTRSGADAQQKPKAGVGFLALRTGVPIIPVLIQGSGAAWPKGARWVRPMKIRVRIGSWVRLAEGPEELEALDPDAVAQKVMAAIRTLNVSQPISPK